MINRMVQILSICLIPLILSIGITPFLLSTDVLPMAFALISKGNSLTETNSNKVCGDRLCSEVSDSAKILQNPMRIIEKELFPSTMDYTVT